MARYVTLSQFSFRYSLIEYTYLEVSVVVIYLFMLYLRYQNSYRLTSRKHFLNIFHQFRDRFLTDAGLDRVSEASLKKSGKCTSF